MNQSIRHVCRLTRASSGSAQCRTTAATRGLHTPSRPYTPPTYQSRCLFTTATETATATATPAIPHIQAPDLLHAGFPQTTSLVASHLQQQGILKITLGFDDPQSRYLAHLVGSLHRHRGHQLPISHSASRGWFWDVRPSSSSSFSSVHQARSETMHNFPWHTDCSYEDPTPRFFALHVLRHDHLGGGTLSLASVAGLTALLSASATAALQHADYEIRVPREFSKLPHRNSIRGAILSHQQQQPIMRFRQDITTGLTTAAQSALHELNQVLQTARHSSHAVHLSPADLPSGSVIVVDNFRWLHARNEVLDPKRHLRRVRWHAVPFGQDHEP